MNRPLKRSFAWAALVLSLHVASPQESALSPLPPGGFLFQGLWDCEGQFRRGQLHQSTYTATVILGGKWLELVEKDMLPATGYEAKYLIGYDSQQKRYVEFDANTFGNATYWSDGGWRDGILTMTSSVVQNSRAGYVVDRFVYSITGPNIFTIDWQNTEDVRQEWKTADHLVCRRAQHQTVPAKP